MSGVSGIAVGIGARAIAGRAAAAALGGLKAASGWLARRKPIELLCLALAIALVVQHVVDRRRAAKLEAQLTKCASALTSTRDAFERTVANYRAAAAAAAAADKANADRVRAQQAKINQETSDAYEARIARARAAAQRLREQLAQAEAHSGRGAAAPLPGLPAPSREPDESTAQDGFSQQPTEVGTSAGPMSISERLTATEQAIQLDELIKWVRRQAAVDVNGRPDERQAPKSP